MDIPFGTEEWRTKFRTEESIDIGFRLQFYCRKCKLILSPNKLVQGCPKCQDKIDLLLV